MPALDGLDDAAGVGHPDEGFGGLVVFGDEPVDSSLKIDERVKRAASRRRPRLKTCSAGSGRGKASG